MRLRKKSGSIQTPKDKKAFVRYKSVYFNSALLTENRSICFVGKALNGKFKIYSQIDL